MKTKVLLLFKCLAAVVLIASSEVAVHIHQHMLEVITEVEAMYSLITVQAEMDTIIITGL